MTTKATDPELILARIEAAERQAAELILHAHGILAEAKTGARDVVTEYDRRVQELLIRMLSESVPDARFFCEEMNERDRLDADRLFIIDPIDGTMNFVHGFHHSCISVAYAEHGTILAPPHTIPSYPNGPLRSPGGHTTPASTCAGKARQRWTSAPWRPDAPACTLS